MTRFKAAGIHLMLSFLIVATVLAVMFLLWYPGEYFTLMGGKTLIALIGFVDVFLVPLLTFVVFKSGKNSLKFDLFCIGLVQIAALTYGTYVMFEARPVFTVFNKDKFQISAVVDITPEELAKAKNPEWTSFSILGPELVGIGVPDKKDKKETIFALQESADAYRYPKLYEPYAKHMEEVVKSGKALSVLSEISAKNKTAVIKFVTRKGLKESDFLFLPISSELAEMCVIVDAKTGNFIEIIDAKYVKP